VVSIVVEKLFVDELSTSHPLFRLGDVARDTGR
jgi:hypothetical protein